MSKINKIFDNLSQTLFDDWFVNFQFPGSEQSKFTDTEFGAVPVGWEIVRVEDLINRQQSGKKFDSKTVFDKGEVPVLDQGKSGIIGYHNEEPGFIADTNNPVIVFANHTCYQKMVFEPFSTIQNVIPFYPSNDPKYARNIYWLHWATKDLIQFNDYKGHWPEFINRRLLLPPESLCEKFGTFAKEVAVGKFELGLD